MIFDGLIDGIYSESQIADKSSNDDCLVVSLNVLVKVGNNCLSTNVYHKVDYFSFPVVLYTFPSRDVPVNKGYNAF